MMWAAIAIAAVSLAAWDGWRRYLAASAEARKHANELAVELREVVKAVREGQEKYSAAVANFLEQQRHITGYQLEKLNDSQKKLVGSQLRAK